MRDRCMKRADQCVCECATGMIHDERNGGEMERIVRGQMRQMKSEEGAKGQRKAVHI